MYVDGVDAEFKFKWWLGPLYPLQVITAWCFVGGSPSQTVSGSLYETKVIQRFLCCRTIH